MPGLKVASKIDSLTLRCIIVGFLALLMLVPLGMVGDIVNERGYRYSQVLSDIASTWGQPQTLLTPVVVIPYTETVYSKETVVSTAGEKRQIEKTVPRERLAHFLPSDLDIHIQMQDEFRQRGIFESLVYAADISVEATFKPFDIAAMVKNKHTVHWDKARIVFGLSDTRAINSVDVFQWNGTDIELAPGTGTHAIPTGFHGMLDTLSVGNSQTGEQQIAIKAAIKGSGSLRFAPFGEKTSVVIESNWPHPSFQGSALPDESQIDADGFSANWNITHLARNYPQRWVSHESEADLFEFTAGVSLFEPVSLYSQITRAVKYGILFIGLTFLTLLIFEMTLKKKLHVVQYALIGVSLSLFYLVLLSLSEHISFLRAYLVSAALTIFMIATYTGLVLRSFARATGVLVLLSSLYAVLFSLLQLEDYALLTGTGLLVCVIITLMFTTRNLDKNTEAGANGADSI